MIQNYLNSTQGGVIRFGIDEFAITKGHVYKTIVVELDTVIILHVGDGKGYDSLKCFFLNRKHRVNIKVVTTDLSPAFISAVMQLLPHAVLAFDHFLVVKLLNGKVDEIRCDFYNQEKDLNNHKGIKGVRLLILTSYEDLGKEHDELRVKSALDINKPLVASYYLNEDLYEIWNQTDKKSALAGSTLWVEQAKAAKVPKLIKFAGILATHQYGILA